MTIPKEIIAKAVEGGWKKQLSRKGIDHYLEMDEAHAAVVLDPLFWQALGKALGWADTFDNVTKGIRFNTNGESVMTEVHRGEVVWQHYVHCFYDLILTGQPTEKFWADLLASQ